MAGEGGGAGGGGGYYGMIISAIGSGMQAYAAWKEQEAVQRATQDEMIRQGKFAGQEYTQWSRGVQQQGAETAQQQMAQAQRDRAQGYSSMEAMPLTTEGALGKRFGETGQDQRYSAMRAGERAKLLSYGDWAHVQNVAKLRVGQNIANIQDKSEEDARIFSYLQWRAEHKLDELSAAGSMIAGLGNADLSPYYSSPGGGKGRSTLNNSGGGDGGPQYPGGSEGDPSLNGYQPFPQTGINYYVPINQQGNEQEIPNY